MGGEISFDDLKNIPREVFKRSPAEREFSMSMALDAEGLDRDNASEAVKALVEIALETPNALLAETCRNAIGLILAEYGASRAKLE